MSDDRCHNTDVEHARLTGAHCELHLLMFIVDCEDHCDVDREDHCDRDCEHDCASTFEM